MNKLKINFLNKLKKKNYEKQNIVYFILYNNDYC